MKIIDLYKLISNKEIDKLPQKIKWRNVTYDLDINEEFINYNPQEHGDWLLNQYLWKLNEEVEIIEEEKKIPEKLDIHYDKENRFQVKVDGKTTTEVICLKINELIDYLKSKGE